MWTGNVAVEVYMQYPSDPAFYRQRTDDARDAGFSNVKTSGSGAGVMLTAVR